MQQIGNPDRNGRGRWKIQSNCSGSVYVVSMLTERKYEEPFFFIEGVFGDRTTARMYLKSCYERYKYESWGEEFSLCKKAKISKDMIVAWGGKFENPDIKYTFSVERLTLNLLVDRMWQKKEGSEPLPIEEEFED